MPLLVLSKTDLYPVTVGLNYWNGLASGAGNNQILFALVVNGAVLTILPVMILFLFLQRYWQNGLALGSIKGYWTMDNAEWSIVHCPLFVVH